MKKISVNIFLLGICNEIVGNYWKIGGILPLIQLRNAYSRILEMVRKPCSYDCGMI